MSKLVNLIKLRKEKNLRQKDVADFLNIGISTYSNWENGINEPDYDSLYRLSEFFNAPVDFILGRDVSKPKGVRIPILGTIRAGLPMEAVENIIGYEEISTKVANSGEFFALKVKGDSMFPKINENDILIIRKQSICESGDICVVLVNGDEATIKKIKIITTGMILVPENPNYDMVFYNNEEIENLPVQILGKAIEIRRSL